MNLKKLLVLLTAAVLLVSLSVTVFATGDSEETAPAAVEDWKAARLEQLKARLEALVADGTITQEQADAFLARVSECMESCDGTVCGNQSVCNGTGRGNGRRGGNGCGSQGQCGRACGNGCQGGVGCGRCS